MEGEDEEPVRQRGWRIRRRKKKWRGKRGGRSGGTGKERLINRKR